jgi:hypothetical protein
MSRLLRSSAVALALASPAAAHNLDCDNKTQAVQALSGCCGKEDYRALRPNEVRADGAGWDVFIDGQWRQAKHAGSADWIIAQPTLAACWGIWYRRGNNTGSGEFWLDHNGNTEDYDFYCLEQPATG